MFGSLGVPELIFIFALALLIFGPRKLPEIGRTIGRGLSEFRKASTDLKRSINAEMIEEEIRESDPRRALRDQRPDVAPKAESGDGDASDDRSPSTGGDETPDARPPEGSVPRAAPTGGTAAGGTAAGAASTGGDTAAGEAPDDDGSES